MKKLGETLVIGSGKDYKHLREGEIPVYGTGGKISNVNDFLYNGDSVGIGRKGTIDKPVFLTGKFWTVDTLFYTHSFKNVIPYFIYLLFQKINWKKYNEASGVPSLSKSTIEKIKLNIPTLPEQKKIANFLTKLDERIQTQRETIKELETLIKGYRQKLFSQELRFKDEYGKDFPDWEETTLGEVTTKKSSNISANSIEENKGDYIIYGAVGKLKKVNFYEVEENYIGIVKDGAGVGRMFYCDEKSSVLGTLDIIKSSSKIQTYFLYLYSSTINFKKHIIGSTIPHIYYRDYKTEKINLPTLKEQEKIANFLSKLDEKLTVEKKLLTALEEQKKFFLQNMFV